jgi:hypothetical protein
MSTLRPERKNSDLDFVGAWEPKRMKRLEDLSTSPGASCFLTIFAPVFCLLVLFQAFPSYPLAVFTSSYLGD